MADAPISRDQFDYAAYAKDNDWVGKYGRLPNNDNGGDVYNDYIKNGATWKPGGATTTPAQTPATDAANATSLTPGAATQNGQMSVSDYAGQIAVDPSKAINAASGTSATAATAGQTGTAAQVDPNDPSLALGSTPTVNPQDVATPEKTDANTYDPTQTQTAVGDNKMEGANGTVSDKAQIKDTPQEDITGIATGVNKDGTVNEVGKALQQYASQNLSTIVDTSTSAGKLLAQQLGEGNYVDSKATLEGQLQILQDQFVDPNTGEPKIPSWAAATARNVSKIAAFSGMTGTAATAAMSQALLEASLPIAQSDASFFQTLTVKNLDNKQQSTINAATVLAKFEQTNLDNRMTAAVQNSQAFLAMDMKNLDNDQQAAVINNQSMIQSILSDANAKNVAAQFNATSENQTDQFYASLNTQIAQFNSSQTLTADQFNANMEDSRQKFYSEQSYNIAVANANWRQQVQLQDDQQKYEAATTDVKNMVDLSTNQLNQLWDRSDALLDYAWKSSESEKDRQATIAAAKIQASASTKGANMGALGSLAGAFVGSSTFTNMMSSIKF